MGRNKKHFREDGSYDEEFAKKRTQDIRRVSQYGITIDDFDAMIYAQGGMCAICGNPPGQRGFQIDHDHRTNVVRELLCTRCNMALGQVDESIETLWRMIMYLRRWKSLEVITTK